VPVLRVRVLELALALELESVQELVLLLPLVGQW
jgi:hypothetical protein